MPRIPRLNALEQVIQQQPANLSESLMLNKSIISTKANFILKLIRSIQDQLRGNGAVHRFIWEAGEVYGEHDTTTL
jgi:hypothetical protein